MFVRHFRVSFVVFFTLSLIIEIHGQKALPNPTNQTHVFDFARFLDSQVTPVKENMDFFFTAFGSADSIKLAETFEILNKRSAYLFATVDKLPRNAQTNQIIDTYLDFARFCMNTRGTLKKWVAVSGRYQWAKRVGTPVPEATKSVFDALVNTRKGYIQQTKMLLQKHNEFCARHSKDFELYPSQRVLELMQDLKFGNAGANALFIDAVASLSRFENGQRYVFNLSFDKGNIQEGQLELETLKENIRFGLPENTYIWQQMSDATQPEHQLMAMFSARYSKPTAPILLIRYNPIQSSSGSYLSLELYSVVPKFLQLIP